MDADYFWSLDYFGGRGLVLGLFSWIILVLGLFLGLFVFLELLGLLFVVFLGRGPWGVSTYTYSSRKSGSVIRDANVP